MNIFTVKLYFDSKSSPRFFSPDKQDSTSEHSDFQLALKKSRDCNSYGACLCTGRELPLAVKLKNEKHHLARFPLTGSKHKEGCRFYSRLSPEGAQGTYNNAAISEKPGGIINVKLDYALQTKSEFYDIPATPLTGDASRKSRRGTVSLYGLLHLLWENASYNKWVPKMDGKRSLTLLGFHLKKQASRIEIGRTLLSDVLLTPAATNSRDSKRNSSAVEFAELNKCRMVVVAELAKYAEKYLSGINRLPVKGFAGMPFLDIDVSRWNSAIERFPHEFSGWKNGYKIFIIALTDVPSDKSAQVRQLALMMTSDRYIPLDSQYEGMVEQKLYELQRSFFKPLRYDSSEMEFHPDFCLLDVQSQNHMPFPIEVWGMKTDAYTTHRREKERWYNSEYGENGWWSWDATIYDKIVIDSSFPLKKISGYTDLMKE